MKIRSVAKNDQVEGSKEDKSHKDLYSLVFENIQYSRHSQFCPRFAKVMRWNRIVISHVDTIPLQLMEINVPFSTLNHKAT